MKWSLSGSLCLLLLCSASLLGHHSISAGFDLNRTTRISGVVTRVDWANPHVQYFVNVVDAAGKNTTWVVEGLRPEVMTAQGLANVTVKIGDRVVASGYPSSVALRTERIAFTDITLPNGKTFKIDPTHWTLPLNK
jgi:hypothetical protein